VGGQGMVVVKQFISHGEDNLQVNCSLNAIELLSFSSSLDFNEIAVEIKNNY
jgi:hypothetical protein